MVTLVEVNLNKNMYIVNIAVIFLSMMLVLVGLEIYEFIDKYLAGNLGGLTSQYI